MPNDQLLLEGTALAPYKYESEAEFERDVVRHATQLFGPHTLYFDVKRRIGADRILTIPDGFLLDFTFADAPRLYVVENELSTHDAYRHIGQQLLKFAVSYRASSRRIKEILLKEVLSDDRRRAFVEAQVPRTGRRNIDALLDAVIYEHDVAAVVIIDEATDELNNVLRHLSMKVDVLEFGAYSRDDVKVYRCTPFHSDLEPVPDAPNGARQPRPASQRLDPTLYDTVIVPARDEGFEDTFIAENRWYSIRISAGMLDRIKYIAAYRIAPTSAITHVAKVDRVQPYGDSGKYELVFDGPAIPIGPVQMAPGEGNLAPQAPRYTTYAKLTQATTLKDLYL